MIALSLLAGCGRPAATPSAPADRPAAAAATEAAAPEPAQAQAVPATTPDGPPPAFAEMETLCAQADELAGQGRVEQATALLQDAMRKESLREFRPEFVLRLLGLLLAQQNLEQAESFFLETGKEDWPAVRHSFGLIENDLFAHNRLDDLAGWCRRLAEAPFAADIMPALADWHFRALRAGQKPEAARQVLELYESNLPPPAWSGLADAMARALLADNQLADYRALLGYLDSRLADKPDLRPVCVSLRLQLLITDAQWPEACAYFQDLAGREDDPLLVRLFNPLQNRLLAEQQRDLADRNSRLALALTNKPALRQAAARTYLRATLQRQEVGPTLARIAELRDQGFGNPAVIGWLSDVYTDAMRRGTRADFEAMLALGQPMFADKLEDRDRAALAGILLDTMFRLDRFAEAVKVLEAGMPGQDAAWHDSMKNKVLAHLALQQGRREEALERFTRFLNESAKTFEETHDPITGDTITRDMVLALNHKRIGDLQAGLNRPDEAARSYAEARSSYEAALKTLDPKSDHYKRLKADRDAVP